MSSMQQPLLDAAEAGRQRTKDSAFRLIHRRSRRSSPSCVPQATGLTAPGCGR
jgi:hypothetical protein